jgi:hypothetical protein
MSKRNLLSTHKPLEYMPNLSIQSEIIDFYSIALGRDRQKASRLVRAHQLMFLANPKRNRSPIIFDEELETWHGRRAGTIRESAGLRREGDNPNSYRNRLRDILGAHSYYRSSLIEAIKTGLSVDDSRAEKIFTQGRQSRGFLLCDNKRPEPTKTWRFLGAPLPDRALFPAENSGTRRANYLRLYQDMPRLTHCPGERYDRAESEVLRFILEKNGMELTPLGNLCWAEKEYNRVRDYGTSPEDKNAVFIYDKSTGETLGVRAFHSELSPEARADKVKAEKIQAENNKREVARIKAERAEDERIAVENAKAAKIAAEKERDAKARSQRIKAEVVEIQCTSDEKNFLCWFAKVCGLSQSDEQFQILLDETREAGLWKSERGMFAGKRFFDSIARYAKVA